MTGFRADLHTHTTFSDGSLTPEELVGLAAQAGLNGLCITDHDTVDAYPNAFFLGKEKGLRMISGAEFSSHWEKESIHILAYSFHLDHPGIVKLIDHHKNRRKNRVVGMLEKLAKYGMPLTIEDLPQDLRKNLGRPHIGLAMIQKGYVRDLQQAFGEWLGEDRPCYVPGDLIDVATTIRAIQEAGGFAVLAHPHFIRNTSIIGKLLQMPFDGIECLYGNLPAHRTKRWEAIAKNKKILITGGSDFHGAIRPNIPIGCSTAPESTFLILEKRFQENNPSLA